MHHTPGYLEMYLFSRFTASLSSAGSLSVHKKTQNGTMRWRQKKNVPWAVTCQTKLTEKNCLLVLLHSIGVLVLIILTNTLSTVTSSSISCHTTVSLKCLNFYTETINQNHNDLQLSYTFTVSTLLPTAPLHYSPSHNGPIKHYSYWLYWL